MWARSVNDEPPDPAAGVVGSDVEMIQCAYGNGACAQAAAIDPPSVELLQFAPEGANEPRGPATPYPGDEVETVTAVSILCPRPNEYRPVHGEAPPRRRRSRRPYPRLATLGVRLTGSGTARVPTDTERKG